MLHVTNGIRALTKSFRSGAICFFMFVTLMVFNMLQLTNDLSEHHRLIESFTSRDLFFMFVSFGNYNNQMLYQAFLFCFKLRLQDGI